jgi:hypothetical protein
MDYKEFNNIYEKILEISSDIFLYLSSDKIEEIQSLLDEKNILCKKLSKESFSEKEEEVSMETMISELKKIDEEILIAFEEKKDFIKEELVKTAKNSKLVSAYIIKSEENQPEMFDARE